MSRSKYFSTDEKSLSLPVMEDEETAYKNPVLKENGYRIPDSVTVNKYGDDILTQKIFNFINSNNNRKPFFVYYSIGY